MALNLQLFDEKDGGSVTEDSLGVQRYRIVQCNAVLARRLDLRNFISFLPLCK